MIRASPARVREILERAAAAMTTVSGQMRGYIKDHPEFEEIGNRMLLEWEKGSNTALRA